MVKTILNYILCCLLNAWVLDGKAGWKTGFPHCLTCSLFPVQCPSLLEVPSDLGLFPVLPVTPVLQRRKFHLLCTSRIQNTLMGSVSELISCHTTPGATGDYFMAFSLCVCVPGINKVVFPEAECVNGSGIRTWKPYIGNSLGFQEMFALSFVFKLPKFKGCLLGSASFNIPGEGLFPSSQFLTSEGYHRAVMQ